MLASQIEDKLKSKIKELFQASVPRYYDHTLKVVARLKDLVVNSSKGTESLLLATYLHDIGYSAPYGNSYVGNIEDQGEKIRVHCDQGAELARSILKELGVVPEIIQRVSFLVAVHHREDIADPELKLLLEADQI